MMKLGFTLRRQLMVCLAAVTLAFALRKPLLAEQKTPETALRLGPSKCWPMISGNGGRAISRFHRTIYRVSSAQRKMRLVRETGRRDRSRNKRRLSETSKRG